MNSPETTPTQFQPPPRRDRGESEICETVSVSRIPGTRLKLSRETETGMDRAGPGSLSPRSGSRRPVRRCPLLFARIGPFTGLGQNAPRNWCGSLDCVLDAGFFRTQAEALRLYRRIATMDASAPLPSLPDQAPIWASASRLASTWGLNQLGSPGGKGVTLWSVSVVNRRILAFRRRVAVAGLRK